MSYSKQNFPSKYAKLFLSTIEKLTRFRDFNHNDNSLCHDKIIIYHSPNKSIFTVKNKIVLELNISDDIIYVRNNEYKCTHVNNCNINIDFIDVKDTRSKNNTYTFEKKLDDYFNRLRQFILYCCFNNIRDDSALFTINFSQYSYYPQSIEYSGYCKLKNNCKENKISRENYLYIKNIIKEARNCSIKHDITNYIIDMLKHGYTASFIDNDDRYFNNAIIPCNVYYFSNDDIEIIVLPEFILIYKNAKDYIMISSHSSAPAVSSYDFNYHIDSPEGDFIMNESDLDYILNMAQEYICNMFFQDLYWPEYLDDILTDKNIKKIHTNKLLTYSLLCKSNKPKRISFNEKFIKHITKIINDISNEKILSRDENNHYTLLRTNIFQVLLIKNWFHYCKFSKYISINTSHFMTIETHKYICTLHETKCVVKKPIISCGNDIKQYLNDNIFAN